MKIDFIYITAGLVVTLLYCCRKATALDFLTLSSYSIVLGDDDSSSVVTDGGFRFGTGSVNYVHVYINGYIIMLRGTTGSTTSPEIPGPHNDLVVPYGADIDTRLVGSVRYTSFSSSNQTQLETVSAFIEDKADHHFRGTKMMVAEWFDVPRSGGSSYTTVDFQAVLITDGYISFAVFIYKCGAMEWNGATIGWQASSTLYRKHPLSGPNSADIGCAYSNTYSAYVYRLNSDCDSDEFACDSGECIYTLYRCDDYTDCTDNSDEYFCDDIVNQCVSDDFQCDNGQCAFDGSECDGFEDCDDNSDEFNCPPDLSGVITGFLVGLGFLAMCVCTVVVICICYRIRKKSHNIQTTIVASTPAASMSASNRLTTPVVYPLEPASNRLTTPAVVYPLEPASNRHATPVNMYPMEPVTFSYPQQQQQQQHNMVQPVYRDAELTSQDAPPSYDAATSYSNNTIPQGYPQNKIVDCYPSQQSMSYPTSGQGQPIPVTTPTVPTVPTALTTPSYNGAYDEAPPYHQAYEGSYPLSNHPSAPQPNNAAGVAANAGFLLQQ